MSDDTLLPTNRADLVEALAYALTHGSGGKPHRRAADYMATIAAETLAAHLDLAGFVVMRKPPAGAPSTPKSR